MTVQGRSLFGRLANAAGLVGPILLVLSALILGGAWFTQLALGWPPCGLCLLQRLPHYWALAIGAPLVLAGLALPRLRQQLFAVTALVAVICYLVALYWAGFHSGVEFGWWPGLESCSGGGSGALSATDLFSAPIVDCTKPQPMFPPLGTWPSMANSHTLVLLLALLLTFRQLLKRL